MLLFHDLKMSVFESKKKKNGNRNPNDWNRQKKISSDFRKGKKTTKNTPYLKVLIWLMKNLVWQRQS